MVSTRRDPYSRKRGWTIAAFAEIIGRSAQTVSGILDAKMAITPDLVRVFSEALGTSVELCLHLQATYESHHGLPGR